VGILELGIGDVRRVPLPAVGYHPRHARVGADEVHDRPGGDPLPHEVRHAPPRHAVEVSLNGGLGEAEELVPAQLAGMPHRAEQAQAKPGQGDVWNRSNIVGDGLFHPPLANGQPCGHHRPVR